MVLYSLIYAQNYQPSVLCLNFKIMIHNGYIFTFPEVEYLGYESSIFLFWHSPTKDKTISVTKMYSTQKDGWKQNNPKHRVRIIFSVHDNCFISI